MKTLLLGIAASLAVGAAYAQTSAPATTPMTTTAPAMRNTAPAVPPVASMPATGSAAASGNSNQAVATTHANAPVPAKGSNSFTMSQAAGRIRDKGFGDVTGLAKDADGVWRGNANKDGTTTTVWLDYKGNVGSP